MILLVQRLIYVAVFLPRFPRATRKEVIDLARFTAS